jgi:DNA (cytosine-5)-methyltransferase 1
MKFISVCSGIEAASVAWGPLGWKAVGFSEIEPFPCAVLAHHYPDVPNYGDLTKWKEWGIERGTVDVICGGTPCQSFSVAGLRKGLDDPRGNLMLVFLALVDAVRPRWVVWENVPGVLSSNGGRDFGAFLGGLGQLGYGWAYRVLDAQYVRVDGFECAVPQRRRRVFVVGCLGDQASAAAVLFEQNCLCGNPAPSREAGKGFAASVGKGVEVGSHWDGSGVHPSITQSHNTGGIGQSNQEIFSQRGCGLVEAHRMVAFGEYETDGTASAMKARDYKDATDLISCLMDQGGSVMNVENGITGTLRRKTKGHEPIICCAEVSPCMTAGGAPFERTGNERTECEAIVAFSCKDNGRDCQANIAPTMRSMGADGSHANGGGQLAIAIHDKATRHNGGGDSRNGDGGLNCSMVAQSMSVRRLTPTECERLMGFPDNYTAIPWRGKPAELCPDGPRYKALGNSWAVNCARWVGTRIQMVEDLKEML